MEQTKEHRLQMVVPQGDARWMSPVVVVQPKRSQTEIGMLKPFGREFSTASGTMVSRCHGVTNMHVLFNPQDELSFGRERSRKMEVLGSSASGEQLIIKARVVMHTDRYWLTKDKEEAQKLDSSGRQFDRHYQDIVMFKTERLIRKVNGVITTKHLGDETGWFTLSPEQPSASTVFAGIGSYTGLFVMLGSLQTTRPYMVVYDRECRARSVDKYGFPNFKGNCHVMSGMSGGAIVRKSDRVMFGLIQGGNLWLNGAPPKQLTQDFFDDNKFYNMPLNHNVAIWYHYDRLMKAMKDHPCER